MKAETTLAMVIGDTQAWRQFAETVAGVDGERRKTARARGLRLLEDAILAHDARATSNADWSTEMAERMERERRERSEVRRGLVRGLDLTKISDRVTFFLDFMGGSVGPANDNGHPIGNIRLTYLERELRATLRRTPATGLIVGTAANGASEHVTILATPETLARICARHHLPIGLDIRHTDGTTQMIWRGKAPMRLVEPGIEITNRFAVESGAVIGDVLAVCDDDVQLPQLPPAFNSELKNLASVPSAIRRAWLLG